jgi:hypothetical protein
MARSWLLELQTQAARWNIPASFVQDLTAKANAADDLLVQDKSAERTKTISAQCKEAFDTLVASMRDLKRHYYLSPSLSSADFISLGLKPQDHTSTAQEAPTC